MRIRTLFASHSFCIFCVIGDDQETTLSSQSLTSAETSGRDKRKHKDGSDHDILSCGSSSNKGQCPKLQKIGSDRLEDNSNDSDSPTGSSGAK